MLPISRDLVKTDVFTILGDGYLYVSHRDTPADNRFTKFARIDAPQAPPFAPLAGASRDADHSDVFYVDNQGVVEQVSWDPTGYHHAAVRPEPELGGVGTAPPGTIVGVIKMSNTRLDAFVIDAKGALQWYEWTLDIGWLPAYRLSDPGTMPSGAPVMAISHDPPKTMEVAAVDVTGHIWNTWWCGPCTGNLWHPSQFDTPTFAPGTQISGLSIDPYYEDMYIVDDAGTVWRAWWSASIGWNHPGYDRLGRFSSIGMLPPNATIAVNHRNIKGANLLAVNADGDLLSEWWDGTYWQATRVSWESNVLTAWGSWGFGHYPFNSLPAMLANVGVDDSLEIYWTQQAGSTTLFWMNRNAPNDAWGTPVPIDTP
jgi:hypothetical protein